MRYYIIAGEASGDLHGANLMKAILANDAHADFRFLGGDLMQHVSGILVKHYKTLAFMGFLEVLLNLPAIFKNLRFCKHDIHQYNPDVIIFIDYPGFNMKIAKWAKSQGYRTHYYISPQIWAWKESRIKAIKRDIDAMYVILPFEKQFYEAKHNYPVHFVGHPLLDAISQISPLQVEVLRRTQGLSEKPIVALLPGSRKQEIKKILPTMLAMVPYFPEYQFVVAGAPSQDEVFYKTIIKNTNVAYINNKTYDILSVAFAALVTSGTATLETALFKVPEVVCYKGSTLSYQIAKRIVKLRYISLVNLIMDTEIVTELIQHDFNAKNLRLELAKLIDTDHRCKVTENYKILQEKLGGIGASQRVAKIITEELAKDKKQLLSAL